MAGTLWLVGTPIGNLGDLGDRARETLAQADVIAAEDTRRTGRLLRSAGIDQIARRSSPTSKATNASAPPSWSSGCARARTWRS